MTTLQDYYMEECEKNEKLTKQNEKLVNCLINIVKSAVHPDKAVRVAMLDLKPIREVLKEIVGTNEQLGIK